MLASEILDKAADEMAVRGLGRRAYWNINGQVCMLGACLVASDLLRLQVRLMGGLMYQDAVIEDFHDDANFNAIRNHLSDELEAHTGIRSVPSWNDKVCKDTDEAVYMLRAAAKRAKAAGQ